MGLQRVATEKAEKNRKTEIVGSKKSRKKPVYERGIKFVVSNELWKWARRDSNA